MSVLPYDMGATRPKADRYGDARFRRVYRWFRPSKLGPDDCLELAAFLHVVPIRFARHVFHWNASGVRAARWVWRKYREQAVGYADANFAALETSTGLAILSAMQDGGWTAGALPAVVRDALREGYRSGGQSLEKFAAGVGLAYAQVHNIVYAHLKKRRVSNSRAGATAALVFGGVGPDSL